mgnify:CR=1 FL=1
MPIALTAYLSTIIIFLAIDYVWLKYVALSFYRGEIGHLMLDKPNLAIAAGFYLLYAIAVTVLAVMPALKVNDWTIALTYGALLGFALTGEATKEKLALQKELPAIMA